MAAAQRPRPAGPSEEEVVRLAARIGELEQDVAEREEWVAASLSAEEMKRRATLQRALRDVNADEADVGFAILMFRLHHRE